MPRKALGRGLSSLLGDDNSETSSSGSAFEIDIDLIEPNSEQPRTRFAEEALEELTQSIRANGIVQPIVVRKMGARYQIVAGERRWRAAQRAGLKKVPAAVKDVSDEKLLELALIENIQRHDLNPVEEARAYRKLIDTIGLTQEQVAERVGKSRNIVATSMRILRLSENILKLIEEEKISTGHARALLLVDDRAAQRSLAKTIIEMRLSVREAEKAANRVARGIKEPEKKLPLAATDPNVRAAEVKLQRHLGSNVTIKPIRGNKAGRVEIEYYTAADLNRIYDLILGKK
jgi:ParB family transcriptional regulator, chromosome partitioning protein